jgi:hypothetical protein
LFAYGHQLSGPESFGEKPRAQHREKAARLAGAHVNPAGARPYEPKSNQPDADDQNAAPVEMTDQNESPPKKCLGEVFPLIALKSSWVPECGRTALRSSGFRQRCWSATRLIDREIRSLI